MKSIRTATSLPSEVEVSSRSTRYERDTKRKVFLEMGLTDHRFVIGRLLVRLRIAFIKMNEITTLSASQKTF